MSRILLSQADVTSVEEEYVLDALRSGWVAPLGPHVDAFEREIAQRVGVAGAVALSSGTAALHVALLGVGAGPETVVVLPSMTFAASANAVVHTGATPVFVDSQMSDGNVDPELLIEAVDVLRAEGAAVSAVMTVDLFGRCVDYSGIVDALRERSIPLVEDAAEAFGATQNGTAAGAFGRAGVLSFNGNKIMTTSGGGMLLSDDLPFLASLPVPVDPGPAAGALVRAHRDRLQLPALQYPRRAGQSPTDPAGRNDCPAEGNSPALFAGPRRSAGRLTSADGLGTRRPGGQLLADKYRSRPRAGGDVSDVADQGARC